MKMERFISGLASADVVTHWISKLRTPLAPATTSDMHRLTKTFLCSVLVGFGFVFSGCAMLHRTPHEAREPHEPRAPKRTVDAEVRTAAVDWLHLVDVGKYQEAFALEAQDPHMSRNRAEFIAYMEEHRTPFGRPESRIG